MLDAAHEATGFFKGIEKRQLHENRMLLLATVKELEIVGEAAAKISAETKENYPEIPWADIIGMRHRLVHAYFDIDTQRSFGKRLPAISLPLSPCWRGCSARPSNPEEHPHESTR